ncbi:MAG: hypothetical protein ACU0CO_17180 [Shimia sp.]
MARARRTPPKMVRPTPAQTDPRLAAANTLGPKANADAIAELAARVVPKHDAPREAKPAVEVSAPAPEPLPDEPEGQGTQVAEAPVVVDPPKTARRKPQPKAEAATPEGQGGRKRPAAKEAQVRVAVPLTSKALRAIRAAAEKLGKDDAYVLDVLRLKAPMAFRDRVRAQDISEAAAEPEGKERLEVNVRLADPDLDYLRGLVDDPLGQKKMAALVRPFLAVEIETMARSFVR